jgi:hypothetical protein
MDEWGGAFFQPEEARYIYKLLLVLFLPCECAAGKSNFIFILNGISLFFFSVGGIQVHDSVHREKGHPLSRRYGHRRHFTQSGMFRHWYVNKEDSVITLLEFPFIYSSPFLFNEFIIFFCSTCYSRRS